MSGEELDRQRGGFVTDSGVTVSFGIEQAVLIDGMLQVKRTLGVPQIGAPPVGDLGAQINVVSMGEQNSRLLNQLPSGVATLIQNTLDQMTIQNITVVNATVSNLAVLRLVDLGVALNQQLVRSLR